MSNDVVLGQTNIVDTNEEGSTVIQASGLALAQATFRAASEGDAPIGIYGLAVSLTGNVYQNNPVVGYSSPCTGIIGEGSIKGTGVIGTTAQGVGIKGLSSDSGTGVNGESISGPGVEGSSQSGPGVKGHSNRDIGVSGRSENSTGVDGSSLNDIGVFGISVNGRGGVFQTDPARGTTMAQVRLIPNKIPLSPVGAGVGGNPTSPGLAGDLLAVKPSNGDASLWFCFRDGVNWKKIA